MESKTQLPLVDPKLLQSHMEAIRDSLIEQLSETRKRLGLTQAELAERAGVARMTVQRAEAPETGTSLSSFLLLALALNLSPSLGAAPSASAAPLPESLAHRGVAYNRTQYDLEYRDREREKALADAWEALNAEPLREPLLAHLFKAPSQEHASTAASIIQWLGSEVGFAFLTEALGKAGYELTDTRNGTKENAPKRSFFAR